MLLTFLDFLDHSAEIDLCFFGQGFQLVQVFQPFHLENVGVAQGKGKFRVHAAPDGCAAGKSNGADRQIAVAAFCILR